MFLFFISRELQFVEIFHQLQLFIISLTTGVLDVWLNSKRAVLKNADNVDTVNPSRAINGVPTPTLTLQLSHRWELRIDFVNREICCTTHSTFRNIAILTISQWLCPRKFSGTVNMRFDYVPEKFFILCYSILSNYSMIPVFTLRGPWERHELPKPK